MSSIKPIYFVLFIASLLFVLFLKVNNPYREFSRVEYWQSATLSSVADIPQEALKLGNKNGPVLMWAAMGSNNPEIIKALVERGADINEADGDMFKGTPLTGAAGYAKNPEIIETLIKLGADIEKRVNNEETALMIAAQYNKNSGIATILVKLGADAKDTSRSGVTALDFAKKMKNKTVYNELKKLEKKS